MSEKLKREPVLADSMRLEVTVKYLDLQQALKVKLFCLSKILTFKFLAFYVATFIPFVTISLYKS